VTLVLTLLVRDEADIIQANLDAHFALGVDHAIVMDNGSEDGTVELVRPYVDLGTVTLWHEPRDDYSQGEWVTRMARFAADELGADWVINADADEFWFPFGGSLPDVLAQAPPDVDVLLVPRYDFPADREPRSSAFWERMTVREVMSTNALGEPLSAKACHRADPDVVVYQGNHEVDGLPGKRGLADVEILHFPLRSWEQFSRKIQNGGSSYARNTTLSSEVGHAWRMLYQRFSQGTLQQFWDERALSPEGRASGLADGSLVQDDRLRTLLRRRVAHSTPRQRGSVVHVDCLTSDPIDVHRRPLVR
jgi:hypothetical protein